jgi:hypothetical protein
MRCILFVTLSLAFTANAFGKKPPPVWTTGKVIDSSAKKTRTGDAATPEALPTISDTQLMILAPEFAYVIEDTRVTGKTSLIGLTERAISNRHHGCRFIVGDDVRFWQEKAILHVIDTDGKECKVEVLRQERLKKDIPAEPKP